MIQPAVESIKVNRLCCYLKTHQEKLSVKLKTLRLNFFLSISLLLFRQMSELNRLFLNLSFVVKSLLLLRLTIWLDRGSNEGLAGHVVVLRTALVVLIALHCGPCFWHCIRIIVLMNR